MLQFIFTTLAAALNLYSIVCIVSIFMSWAPGLKFTSFGRFMSAITDPYLNLFSKIKFLRIGYVDFSPIIAIGLLSLFSSVFSHVANTGRIYFGGILYAIIQMFWSLTNTILIVFCIALFVRWIVLLVNNGRTPSNSAWNQVDQFLQTLSYKLSRIFVKKTINYQTSLLISWITGALILLAGNVLIRFLLYFCYRIPF